MKGCYLVAAIGTACWQRTDKGFDGSRALADTPIIEAASTESQDGGGVAAVLTRSTRWLLTAVGTVNILLGVWRLGRAGWQNVYYAAGVQSGSQDWSTLWFVGLDPAGGATVDKPPLAFWLMGASVRLFGFNSWSMLVPQVAIGLASSLVLFGLVRRLAGARAGLLAAAALTLTPVSVWMSRGNYPDPLMEFLVIASAYCVVRSLPKLTTKWMLASGAMIGLAFLSKTLEALLIAPASIAVVIFAGSGGWYRRILVLLGAVGAAALASGWWFVLVDATPSRQRPYVAGTAGNSVIELALGYNGADRIGQFGLANGVRLFVDPMASLASFLLPGALVAIPLLRWSGLGRTPGAKPRVTVAMMLFGIWLTVGAATLTFSTGIINPYYVLAIAPPIAGLVGVAVSALWESRRRPAAAFALLIMIWVTALWGTYRLLPAHLGEAIASCVVAIAASLLIMFSMHGRLLRVVSACVVTTALLLPTGAAAVRETSASHEAPATVADQPAVVKLLSADRSGTRFTAAVAGGRNAAYLELAIGRPVLDIGGFNGRGPLPAVPELQSMIQHRQVHYFIYRSSLPFGLPNLQGSARWPSIVLARWISTTFKVALWTRDVLVFDLTAHCVADAGSAARTSLSCVASTPIV